ncbi:MAG: alpha/beta hydrolase family protein, partial [Opitutaceae bacterium]
MTIPLKKTSLAVIALLLALLAATRAAESAAGRCSFPPVDQLPDNPMLPDPFKKPDGTRVAGRAEWKEQRAYLKALLEHYLYGTIPPRPTSKELSFTRTSDEPCTPPDSRIEGRKQGYRITISRNGLTHSFSFNLWRPAKARRYSTLINNHPEHGHPSPTYSMAEGVRRGYAVVEFERTEVAPDDKNNADRHEGIFRLYPDYDFHTIGAWSWAYQPVIDVLDQLGVADMKKIISTGHSRGGFTAMAAAIFDERIAMAAPSAAGPFSTGSVRQRDPAGFRGTADYPDIISKQFPHWFHPRYLEFAKRQNKFPWDVTTLTALVAPRPLLSLSSVGDGFDNWLAHEVGIRSGMMIYDWFGVGKWCRIYWRDLANAYGQKGHDEGPEEFNAIYDYADEYFFGKGPG